MLTNRSTEKELLDLGPAYYTPEEFSHCQELFFRINKLSGILNSTSRLLKKFPKTASVVDVGCGGGLFLSALGKQHNQMTFLGIDISQEAITLADKISKRRNVNFKHSEVADLHLPENSVDVILATLVCHHMSDAEIIAFLQSALSATRCAVIINDLHRHLLAELIYRLISPLLFNNRLTINDGRISIKRSFIYADWKKFLAKACIKHYQIKWHFPFRWQVVLWKK